MGQQKTNGLARLVRRFGRKDDGATAVEFALVAFPFFALLLVIFESAIVMFTDISLQNGVTAASRLIRTGQLQTQGMSQTAFKKVICDNVASYIDCSKIRIDVTKSSTAVITGVNQQTVDDKTNPRALANQRPVGLGPGAGPL